MSEPKANPDVLRVDGPTRCLHAHIERVATASGPATSAVCVECSLQFLPISAEPSLDDDPLLQRGTMPVLSEPLRMPVPEPSPDPLREARFDASVARTELDMAVASATMPLREALERILRQQEAVGHRNSKPAQIARAALRTDQSQSDRTSDEAAPAEPTYEWAVIDPRGRLYLSLHRRDELDDVLSKGLRPGFHVERRTAPGPWERVPDEEGRRDG